MGYCNLLTERVYPSLLENFGDQFENDRFCRLRSYDGAPAHTHMLARDLLVKIFQDRVIAHHRQPEQPARSPDLTAWVFLWGYMKNKVLLTHI